MPHPHHRLAALLLGLAALAGCAEREAAAPSDRDDPATAWARDLPGLQAALKATEIADWSRRIPAGRAPLIEIDAKLDPASGIISGIQRAWIAAPAATPIAALRCPANAAVFHGAGIHISRAAWNGVELAAPMLSPDGTGFSWALPQALAAGAAGCLSTAFTATCSSEGGFHGLMARQGEPGGGHWCLYHWHPELAAWRDGGWFLPPVTGIGDESQTTLAPVLAHLTVPTGTQVISAGIIDRRPAEAGWETLTIAAPTCRNLALEVVTGTAERMVGGELVVDGVHVRSWATKDDADGGARALAVAAASVLTYDRDFGNYPLNGLDVVETSQGDDVGGMESSGLVFIDSAMVAGVDGLTPQDGLENLAVMMLTMAVAHEVGHQWWYGLVGSDAFADPWLDESLTNASQDLVVEQLYGAPGRKASRSMHQFEGFSLPDALTEAIDRPLAAYSDMNDYGAVVYGRGALMYLALRNRLGDARFIGWLRAWQEGHRYGVATEADWHAHLAEILGADEAGRFSDLWLSGHDMTRAVVMAQVFAPAASATSAAVSATAAQPGP